MAVARGFFFITIGGAPIVVFLRKIVVSICLDRLIGIVVYCLKFIHNHNSTYRGFMILSIGINAVRSIFFF